MSRNPASSRSRRAGLVAVLVAAGGAVLIHPPAASATSQQALRPTSWTYTDSRTPDKAYTGSAAAAPVGAWRDAAGKHKSRSYFSYDISAYRGMRINAAGFVLAETQVTDCRKERTWQLWSTDPVTSTTSWNRPPRERQRFEVTGADACPSSYIGVDLGTVVRDALAAGRRTVTFELRVPDRLEGNLHYGRHVRNDPALIINANGIPGTPAQLTVDGRSCDTGGPLWVTTDTPQLTALLTDADINDTGGGDVAYGRFAVWPVDRPQDRVELPENFAGYTPARSWGSISAGILTDGGTYAVAAQSRDDMDVSPWSAECRFTVDTSHPAPPVVSSTDYPPGAPAHGGPGIPGAFTFTANGTADVAGYQYGESYFSMTSVAAPTLGGPVTIQLAPSRAGILTLYVQSVDRAGNLSEMVSYRFLVRNTAPAIEDADPDAWLGDPHHLTFAANLDGTVAYTYQIDGGTQQTVPAEADGKARVTVVPGAEGTTVSVFSTTAAGVRSGASSRTLFVDTEPFVDSADFPTDGSPGRPVGTEGVFTLKPHMHGVVAYTYQFNQGQVDEQPPGTVAAGADGTATVRFTPGRAGYNTLTVTSRTADGTESEITGVSFVPASIAPVVTSADYPPGDWQGGGGPGVEGTFVFHPTAAGVVSYTYQFGAEQQQTVAAEADGTATVRWTPLEYPAVTGGWVDLLVRSTSDGGPVSDWAYVTFRIRPPS
ncbi:hypothetical protein ACQEVZ_56550 [Dactylosporangium sp. CA-152071]|uniref:hypothetical protein n=1 Tax=Dactylosporangium sp. CA-152071 TaxID=3239933 RepID=UPI003D9445E0